MSSSPEPLPEEAAKTSVPRRSIIGWPAAVCVIALALVGLGGFVFKTCQHEPAKIVEAVSKAIQPQITVNTIIQTSLERLRDESKLVVYTADIAVMVTK